MTNISVSAGKATRPSYIPEEPATVRCDKCGLVTYKGASQQGHAVGPCCSSCGAEFPQPTFDSPEDADAWCEQTRRDRFAFLRWEQWQERKALKTVPPSHPRYAAWMAFRCFLLDQVFLRRAEADLVAHIAAVITLGVECRDGAWWFGDLLMDEDLASDLYSPEHDNSDRGFACALLSLSSLLVDPVGIRDDILPTDHAIIVGAF